MRAEIENNSSFKERVHDIVQHRIRPLLTEHGGDLFVKEIKGNDVGIVFSGACAACPSAQITVEDVVEKELRKELKEELGRVYLIHETNKDLLDFARKLLKK